MPMNSKLNSALVVVTCLLCTSITGATPLPRTDDRLAQRATPVSLRDIDIHSYPSLIPRDSLVHNLFSRMPDDIVPAGQKCPVGTKKYPKRPHEAIDEAVDKEHAVGVLTGQFGTKEPENKELMAKFQQLARLADGQHDAHCELLEIEGKLKDRKIDKGDAGITLKRVIDLHGQVSIDDHKEVASSIIRCIVLDPELEPKLEEKLAKKLEPESARMLILKVQAALAYLRKKAKGSGSGHAAPLLPHSKRARRS